MEKEEEEEERRCSQVPNGNSTTEMTTISLCCTVVKKMQTTNIRTHVVSIADRRYKGVFGLRVMINQHDTRGRVTVTVEPIQTSVPSPGFKPQFEPKLGPEPVSKRGLNILGPFCFGVKKQLF